jgi:hypothetical protein
LSECFGQTVDQDEEDAFLAMIRAGWARPEGTFRRVFTNMFIPGASDEQMAWLDDLQRMSTSPENAIAGRRCLRERGHSLPRKL